MAVGLEADALLLLTSVVTTDLENVRTACHDCRHAVGACGHGQDSDTSCWSLHPEDSTCRLDRSLPRRKDLRIFFVTSDIDLEAPGGYRARHRCLVRMLLDVDPDHNNACTLSELL